MERGLQLPQRYHPDLNRYDRIPDIDDTDDLLRFNCYEAHIPYTMQFFKDYNLAGMSYVHVRKGRIRGKLPKRYSKGDANHNDSLDCTVFLQSNTSKDCMWPNQSNDKNDEEDFTSFCYLRPNFSPPQKNTTCDVEIDCTVHEISNVDDVLTTMPSDQDESDEIQWRAVPSLREIWKEERARMKQLLSPELTQEVLCDVLHSTKPTTFTLNVKKSAPRSGTKPAIKGMWSLVNVSDGLQEDFVRSLTDILERHKEAIRKVDEQLQKGQKETAKSHGTERKSAFDGREESWSQFTTPINRDNNLDSNRYSTPSMNEAISALKSLGANNLDSEFKAAESCPPSVHEAIDALDSMTSASPGISNSNESPLSVKFPPLDDERDTFSLPAEAQKSHENVVRNSDRSRSSSTPQTPIHKAYAASDSPATQLSHPYDSQPCSQPLSYQSSQDMHMKILSASLHPVEFSQRMERGDSVLNAQDQDVEDLIDPDTLAPYERIVFGEGCCRAIFVVDTDTTNIKRICGLNAASCLREGHEFAENRAKPGIYDTITTGGVVDGQMDTSNCKSDDEDEDCSVLEEFCQRSQAFIDPPSSMLPLQSMQIPAATPIVNSLFTQGIEDSNFESIHGNLTSHQDELDQDEMLDRKAEIVTLDNNRNRLIGENEDVICSDDAPITEKNNSPILHPQERISLAPTRQEVNNWNVKQKRKQIERNRVSPRRKKKLNEVHETNKIQDDDNLIVDSNSRMIVPTKGQNQDLSDTQEDSQNALDGICNQGGRIFVQGGGGLKAKTTTSNLTASDESCAHNHKSSLTPITIMSVEVHVQCRVGTSRLDSNSISMTQDSNKDKVTALVYVYAIDRGGGESLEILSRGCICLTLEGENPGKDPEINKNAEMQLLRAMPRANMGVQSSISIEVAKDERHLLRRFKDIVRMKDPDLMLSWDTQGAGIGYIIERGHIVGNSSVESSRVESAGGLDMAKLLGRTPMDKKAANFVTSIPGGKAKESNLGQIEDSNENLQQTWRGSGLGSDWDDRVGAGAAAASIVGRLVFSGWKIVAEEVKHPNVSYLPAVVYSVLNKRIPHHEDLILTKWYASGTERWRVLSHRLAQATACLLLFDALDVIGRAGEAARLSGVEFSQSFPGIRGSQYKVEGVLLRALQSLRSDERGSKKGRKAESNFSTQTSNISSGSGRTKSQSQSPWKVRRTNFEREESPCSDNRQYFFFSPSQEDTKKQEALEVQALTLEPQSGHFTDPVVVCDFTALYPSLIIAYNLCYSTCAGKLDYHSTRREMQMEGKTRGNVGPIYYPERRTSTVLNHHLKSISNASCSNGKNQTGIDFSKDRVYVAPTGTIYLAESVLKGVLPQVLDEMLTTRAMLKRAAKEYKKHVKNLSPAILRQLEARQLALKYVANVTYGYTSATFSGRCAMPLLADTIVECGRRTLQKAMHLANRWGQGVDPWGKEDSTWLGAEVIYGDTDSLFIKMPGRSYKEAFEFGEKFCMAVTSLNPPPVNLKLEKVYLGSIMQTMKRYCGMKFDSKNQKKPTFEAKGLETIRRDQCALTQKVLENALITLFKHGIEAVKEYLFRQWSLIFAGELPVSDFILTGRVRSKYRGGKEGPVQAVLSRRLGEADPGRVIKHKERLSYVIVATPGVTFRLKDCVLTPQELLERWDAYKIHSMYYIERHLNAALQRCLGLPPHKVTVSEWFALCPKPRRRTHFWAIKSKRAMITAYFGNDVCSLCQRKCKADGSSLAVVCEFCRKDGIGSIQLASTAINKTQNSANIIAKKCSKCNGCFESAETFAVTQQTRTEGGKRHSQSLLMPLANCVCIDCPTTYHRHRLREQGIEAKGVYGTLTGDTEW